MKLLISSVTFLLFLCAVIVAGDLTGRFGDSSFIPSVKAVSNASDKPIPLYTENAKANHIVTYLNPGLSLPFAYSGNTGGWNYVFLGDTVVSVRSKNVSYSYRLFDSFTVSLWMLNGVYWASMSGGIISLLVMLSVVLFGTGLGSRHEIEEVLEEFKLDFGVQNSDSAKSTLNKEKHQQDEVKKNTEAQNKDRVRKEKKPVKSNDSEASLQKARMEKERLEKERLEKERQEKRRIEEVQAAEKLEREKERKRREYVAARKAKLEARSQDVKVTADAKREKSRLRHDLITTANDESGTRYRGQATLVEMKASYTRLLEKYQQVKAEASGIGIEFEDQKYEDLLRGRNYQVCVVTSLIEDKKFRMLEWYPGKNFESDANHVANINPNLIMQSMSGNVFGIVCKYRTSYYLSDKEKEIYWASVKQAEEYKRFSKSRNMPIFIAIGVKGKSIAPKYNFMVPFTDIFEKSRKDNHGDMGFQLIVKYKQIGNSFVKDAGYSDYLATVIK